MRKGKNQNNYPKGDKMEYTHNILKHEKEIWKEFKSMIP